mmetsp:Transcript_21726/g.60411  ORF Transcript_21726/g.60411 Transcript_21726/m.60411 type:complete len:324 (-) Transcript_21726:481-1452(-)|eukprot:CAMPEP_0117697902 /NCGR_PEP_ID=MMETSP0804-20121206/29484_1 /TAXON_ID=1074897 /ORGANISM="Tetraselmis astigmatica, Strain CCMP880" /LENGTH=323 /DNA_ID=CAMNT_0005512199 /DNA_START=382 /DNA_END=1353 /DNA_ORIENTATION=-
MSPEALSATRKSASQQANILTSDSEAESDRRASHASGPSFVESPSGHRYLVGHVVGVGSFSLVRAVTDSRTGKNWACKIIPLGKDGQQKEAETFGRTSNADSVMREIEMLSRCQQQQGVVQLRESFVLGDCVFMVTEMIPGVELLDIVAAARPVGEQGAREISRQLLATLRHMHGLNVAHRDIKLENVLVSPNSNGSASVKLIDFGLADDTSRGPLDEVCGTLHFIAPEVLSPGSSCYGKECDIWSLGVTLFSLLSGRYPFGDAASDAGAIAARVLAAEYSLDSPEWAAISDDAKDILRKMLEVNPFLRVTAEEALQHPWFLS